MAHTSKLRVDYHPFSTVTRCLLQKGYHCAMGMEPYDGRPARGIQLNVQSEKLKRKTGGRTTPLALGKL